MQTMVVPQGEFLLKRFPQRKDEQLRAWDAADEYLLSYLQEHQLITAPPSLLIMNDGFGALSIALANCHPTSTGDSCLSQQALLQNAQSNNVNIEQITLKTSLQPLERFYDIVLIKVPKNLALLEDELFRVRPCCNEHTVILAAGMSRHIHSSTLQLFERIIGPTQSTLARKKARLISSQFDESLRPGTSPYPSNYKLDTKGEVYLNHANVFSRDKPDAGTRLLMPHIPHSPRFRHILDLGCGNGLLGIAAARLNPQAKVTFVDESFMAVASATYNVQTLLNTNDNTIDEKFDFRTIDCLTGIEKDSLDLILNNPPFHQDHVVGDFIAWKMFKDAKEKLRVDGELWIVGNNHLGYPGKLKHLFGNCQTIASSRKFVVLKSVKRSKTL